MKKSIDLAVVVISCDNYSDIWIYFDFYFKKNWPDCPFDKYFITNKINYLNDDFKTIKVGEDTSWSENLIKAISQIQHDYYLFFLDDIFLSKKVNTPRLLNIFDSFKKLNGNYLKLIPEPKTKFVVNDYFSELPAGSLYRATCVYALYKSEIINSILEKGESAWEFEKSASIRSDNFDKFYVSNNYEFFCYHGVVKRKFLKSTYNQLIHDGFDLSKVNRGVNSGILEIKLFFLKIRHSMFYFFIPIKYRRLIRSIFLKT